MTTAPMSSATAFDCSLSYLATLVKAIQGVPPDSLQELQNRLLRGLTDGRTLFLAGNGGSAATASHMMCDMNKGASSGSRRVRVISLTDNVPLITAWANDQSYEDVFAEQLRNLMRRDDMLLAISGSGNSPNILKALEVARANGLETFGLSGYTGGRMAALCDFCLVVPSDNMQIIEDAHHAIAHALFSVLKNALSPKALATAAGI